MCHGLGKFRSNNLVSYFSSIKRLGKKAALLSSLLLTSAKTKGASNWKQIWPCLMAWTEAGPHRYIPATHRGKGSMSLSSSLLSRYRYRLWRGKCSRLHHWLSPHASHGQRRWMTKVCNQEGFVGNASSNQNLKPWEEYRAVTMSLSVLPPRTHTPDVCSEAELFAYRGLIHLHRSLECWRW